MPPRPSSPAPKRNAVRGCRSFARLYSLLFFGFVLMTIAACADKTAPLPPLAYDPYRLDSGDKIRVTVFGQQELTNTYSLSDTGAISMPLVGPVSARGLTVDGLEGKLRDELRQSGILTDPAVSVQVESYRPFFILGEVTRPGQYPYVNRMTVLTAVAIAGGFTYRANTDSVTITRDVNGQAIEGQAVRTADIAPGDVIVVHERFF